MILQNISSAFSSIWSAKLRSFLTILGIIIGIASVVTVIAAGEGVKTSIREQVTSLGTNLVQINPGQAIDDSEGEGGGGFNFASSLGASTLKESDLTVIRNTKGVEVAAPYAFVTGLISVGNTTDRNAFIGATSSDYINAVNSKLSKGRFIAPDEDTAKVVVIGSETAKKLFGTEDPIGKTVKLRNNDLKVIGVFEEIDTGFSFGVSLNNMVLIPFGLAKTFGDGNISISEIEVKVAPNEDVDKVVAQLKTELKKSHDGTQDFTVTTAEDQLKVFDTVFSLLTTFIAAIAAISLLVGGIGVMNIMLVAVSERTREIGIRKALGASFSNIMSQFLMEAVILSLLGGLLGFGLAYLFGLLINRLADITPVYTPSAFILAFGVSFIVGIVFGVAPAIKAARKRPIQALKAL